MLETPILLSLNALGTFTDDEFYHFCLDNPDLKFERNTQGRIIIMPNTGRITGDINARINYFLTGWNMNQKLGKVFDSSTAFRLPNSAVKSPDASCVSKDRWNQLTDKQKKQFPPLCPDFVIELSSESYSLKELQTKMEEWMQNGCQLVWLIDPKNEIVYIYRWLQENEIVKSFDHKLSGETILPGFELDLRELR